MGLCDSFEDDSLSSSLVVISNAEEANKLFDDPTYVTRKVGTHTLLFVWVIARVTVLFGIKSASNVIEIARGESECYFDCFTSAIDP